jgi:hypothetical protein
MKDAGICLSFRREAIGHGTCLTKNGLAEETENGCLQAEDVDRRAFLSAKEVIKDFSRQDNY